MALVDAHHNQIATPATVPGLPPAAGQPLINVNQLRTAFSNPKADIPLIYADSTLENMSAKLSMNRIRISHTTYV